MIDLLIKDGLIVDGSSTKPYYADISIKEQKIHQIEEKIKEKTSRIVDAKNFIVSPGFIDSHTHTDLTILLYPSCESALRQGITTEIVGNCGLSSAPLNSRNREYWKKYMNFIGQNESIRLDADWNSVLDFFTKIESKHIGTNIAYLVGHNTLRSSVMGVEGKGGERQVPDENELKELKNELTKAFSHGATGFSTGLGYPVGRNAETFEIIELCKITSKNHRIYASHIRSGPDALGYNEFYEIIKETKVRAIISHVRGRTKHYPPSRQNNSTDRVDLILNQYNNHRNEDLEVYMDVIPISSGLNSLTSILFGGWGLSDTNTIFTTQGKLTPISRLLENISDSEKMKKLKNTIMKNPYIKISKEKDTRIIHFSKNNEQYEGKTLMEIANNLDLDPLDAIMQILLASDGDTRWGNTCIEEDLEKLFLSSDAIPCSDGYSLPIESTTKTIGGIPGPRIYGTFPYFISKYQKAMPMENIINRLTHKPAQIFNLSGRGIIKSGYFADIVIFDPQTIHNNSTFSNPCIMPSGIKTVIQNGKISLDRGQIVSLNGQIIKKINA